MCGRFSFFVDDGYDEIFWILNKLNEKYPGHDFHGGDIFPSAKAPVYVGDETKISVMLFSWGFPKIGGKKVIFNTRSEEAARKPMWAESLSERRCIIPSTGFYEWDKDKTQYHFKLPNYPLLYMAGIYKIFDGKPCFSILTTGANSSLQGIHHRMPMILTDDNKRKWLAEPDLESIRKNSVNCLLQRDIVKCIPPIH